MINRICQECGKEFRALNTEVKRGGGKTCSNNCRIARQRKVIKRGEQSPNWKGANVGYGAVHDWIKTVKGRPNKCEDCGTTSAKKYEWANLSGQYLRDVNDWKRLCTKCHMKLDKHYEKRKKTLQLKYGTINVIDRDKLTGRFLPKEA